MTAATRRPVRIALLAVVALAAVLLSMAAMHASMVDGHQATGHSTSTLSIDESMQAAMASPIADGPSSDHVMGDMSLTDCLLLGMVCFLMSVALLLLAVALGRLRSVLRPRALAQASVAVLSRLRPPDPPSLLVLSISRT
jgi:hypothetical protein